MGSALLFCQYCRAFSSLNSLYYYDNKESRNGRFGGAFFLLHASVATVVSVGSVPFFKGVPTGTGGKFLCLA